MIETKYSFALGHEGILRTGLEAACVEDAEHPRGRVHSIYFETPGRLHLAEKVNSDYLKTKVRLRWYTDLADSRPAGPVPAFLEVKSKQGVRRRKERVALELPPDVLRADAASMAVLEDAVHRARECGYVPLGPLFPMIAIQYLRHRFVEPRAAARISLDSQISSTVFDHRFFPVAGARTLRHGVLEVKSKTGDLPRSFLAVRNFLNRKDSFSKYEVCWQMQADPLYRREFQWMHFER